MAHLPRLAYERRLLEKTKTFPIVAIIGARQTGKTTLAGKYAAGRRDVTHLDLEDPRVVARLANPALTLEPLKGLVILDEIQRMPELFPLLRVLADRPDRPATFLILGSASPQLVRGVSESLAGRVGFIELGGFDLGEVGLSALGTLWIRGGFPPSFLAGTERQSLEWRNDFISTFLQRDIPQLGINIPAPALRRFWTMVAHFHGQVWNAAELARSLGSSEPTARRYLDILTSAFMVRQLQPWHENITKRQVKSPKVYLRDSGLLHALLMVETHDDLAGHPKVGASWEGYALQQVLRANSIDDPYFWATHAGAELDLFFQRRGKRYGVEFKYTDTPKVTKSMRTALSSLDLERLFVVCPAVEGHVLHEQIDVCPLGRAFF